MKRELIQLEDIITANLIAANDLRNSVDKKELDKHDLLKEIAISIIDVLDSFERVEDGIIERGQHKNEDVARTMKRYQTINSKLINILQKHGISRISFPDNVLIFGLCEVVETEIDANKKNDEIVSIVRNGYILGKELIRAAQVIIIKN